MSQCAIYHEYQKCSSRDFRNTCDTCYHYTNVEDKQRTLSDLILNYKGLLNLKNSDQKGNLKFVESYVSRTKKKNIDKWMDECVWFVCEAIDLHMKTFGKR